MDLAKLQTQLKDYTSTLFHEGILDDQFKQLQELEDENNPDFVVEVVSLFFQDSDRLLHQLSQILEQETIDFKKVDGLVHQFKGSSSSIGAQRVQKACTVFRSFCDQQNIQGCLQCLEQLKHEYSLVKEKLESLFKLQQQLVAAGGSITKEMG